MSAYKPKTKPIGQVRKKVGELSDSETGMAFARTQNCAWQLAIAGRTVEQEDQILIDFERIVNKLWPIMRAQVMVCPSFSELKTLQKVKEFEDKAPKDMIEVSIGNLMIEQGEKKDE